MVGRNGSLSRYRCSGSGQSSLAELAAKLEAHMKVWSVISFRTHVTEA